MSPAAMNQPARKPQRSLSGSTSMETRPVARSRFANGLIEYAATSSLGFRPKRMGITLVIGGARSGKSTFAESLAHDPKIYIATAQAFDEEMRERIAKHQEQRGPEWVTYDTPVGLVETLKHADDPKAFILVDCLTLWISNLMLEGMDWEKELEGLIMTLGTLRATTVLVSNEVGLGIVPDTELGRKFRDAQGITNQSVAEMAENVVLMTAGLPLALKGTLPEPKRPRRTGSWRAQTALGRA
jgi:adenosylcobinamide kinase / adenosylcobinamide-phosphate guanylyltransferase